jgi:hypothetical protein
MSNIENNTQSFADKTWNSIKDREVQMFSLPGQTVAHYCTPTPLDPNKLFLTYTVSSCIPAVEAALNNEFDFEIAKNFIIISKKV